MMDRNARKMFRCDRRRTIGQGRPTPGPTSERHPMALNRKALSRRPESSHDNQVRACQSHQNDHLPKLAFLKCLSRAFLWIVLACSNDNHFPGAITLPKDRCFLAEIDSGVCGTSSLGNLSASRQVRGRVRAASRLLLNSGVGSKNLAQPDWSSGLKSYCEISLNRRYPAWRNKNRLLSASVSDDDVWQDCYSDFWQSFVDYSCIPAV